MWQNSVSVCLVNSWNDTKYSSQISFHSNEEAWRRSGEEWHTRFDLFWQVEANGNICIDLTITVLLLSWFYCSFFYFLIDTSDGDNLYNLLKLSCFVHNRVGFRMSFHLYLFADEAAVEMWCGCVLAEGVGSFSLRPTSLSNIVVSHSHTWLTPVFYVPLCFCLWCNPPFYLRVLNSDC